MKGFKRAGVAGAAVALTALYMFTVGAVAAPVVGTNVLYTSDADFDRGALVNLNHDGPNHNQLQLNETTGTFPFIWVSLSQRCTIAKINTATGAILGEFRTIADGVGCNESSRTTVALDGSVWMGHRGPGGVTHIGLAELNQCLDRNGNGTIDTSTGYGDVKPWSGGTSLVANAEDECILHHVDTDAHGLGDSRHMSIDASNNLWVGDYGGGHNFVRINGNTGALATEPRSFGCGGYGGLIDKNGVIWSSNGGSYGLLRWNPNAPDSETNPRCLDVPVYGLAIDPNGFVWASVGSEVRKVSPDGDTVLGPFSHGAGLAQGLAVSGNGDVWVSSGLFCSSECTIGHLKNDGTFVGNVDNPTGAGSTGISIDAAGNVWSANRSSNTATRINPSGGPMGADGVTPIGEADLTVDFPAGPGDRPLPYPYNYSDMTGAQLLTSVSQGLWTIMQDSGAVGTAWGTITWNTEAAGNVPAGAHIKVEARAANTEAGLGSAPYTEATNGSPFTKVGRYIQVRATLTPNDQDQSPVLSDIRVQAAPAAPAAAVDSITASCSGNTLTANATAHGDSGSTFTLTLYRSNDGTSFTATDQSAMIDVTGTDAASYQHAFTVSGPAHSYKVVAGNVESNVVPASACAPGSEIPEAPAALLLPLSLLGMLALGAGAMYVRRRRPTEQ
jgi:streptogramin lyase